jgi:hypothetical protein
VPDTEEPPSGKDLARMALANWKAAAKGHPGTKGAKPRKKSRADYSNGRDPIGLGSVLGKLAVEGEWKTAVAGGSLVDRWPELCPELVGKVAPERFDVDTGRLDLRPASPAYATQLRLLAQQLVTRLQAKDAPVRAIRVLAPGTLPAAGASEATPAPEPAGPTQAGREAHAEASAGYLAALEAHLAGKTSTPDTEIQQRIKAAAQAQTEALRARHEDADGHRDAVWFVNDLEEKAAAEREQARQDAIRRARAEKAGRGLALPTVFQQTA